jgi:hypothetical protein
MHPESFTGAFYKTIGLRSATLRPAVLNVIQHASRLYKNVFIEKISIDSYVFHFIIIVSFLNRENNYEKQNVDPSVCVFFFLSSSPIMRFLHEYVVWRKINGRHLSINFYSWSFI